MRIFLTFMLLFATVLTHAQEKSIVSDLDNLKVNLALLKMNQFSDVKSGENHGKKFVHDFVVAQFVQFDYEKSIKKQLGFLSDKEDSILVVWITQGERLENLQAVAGYL